MKKLFIEPEIVKFELNLRENIASSGCAIPDLAFISRDGVQVWNSEVKISEAGFKYTNDFLINNDIVGLKALLAQINNTKCYIIYETFQDF